MEKKILAALQQEEIDLLLNVDDILKGYYYDKSVMHNAYVRAKEKGCIYLGDIIQFHCLGLPILDLIPLIKNEPRFDTLKHLNAGEAISFQEIQNVLNMFVFAVYSHPKTLKIGLNNFYHYLSDQVFYLSDFIRLTWKTIRF